VSVSLAVLSSNQDRNIGVVRGYSEAGGMRILGDRVAAIAAARGLVCRTFHPALESQDGTQYEALYKAFPEARNWLDAQARAGRQTLLMHLHSDAGGGSHSGYCYSTKRPVSQSLGKALAERCQRALKTATVLGFDRTDWLWDKHAGSHPTVYLEVCAHDVKTDLDALYASVDAVAAELVDGALAWAGEGTQTPAEAEVATLKRRNQELEAELSRYKAAVLAAYTTLGRIV
jgi:hypothetical protein